MTMNRLLLPVGVILTTFCCCPFAPVAQYLITEEPKEEDIVGVYEFSGQSVVDQDIQHSADSSIALLADGTCNLTDFPVFVENDQYGFTYKFKELFTGSCQWNVATNGSVSRDGKAIPTWAVCFSAANFDSAIKCADLANNGNPYNLVFIFGDPDSNDILSFTKPSSK